MSSTEPDIPTNLPERVDSAVRALRQGDSTELEHLLEWAEGTRAGLGELLAPVLQRREVAVAGLADQSQVGGYKIIREIGRGGMGIVYEAEQREPRRRVALKVLRGPWADEHRVKLFRREIQTLARLRHPAIATIFEAGQTEDGQHFFTMELVTGTPLQAHVREHDLPLRARLELFIKICEAVHHAHEQGVIHRDLKPANIMADAHGSPRVLDFGLARVIDPDATATILHSESGVVMGTLAYMSPEQACGQRAVIDARTDVYALGVILYELLTGQLPYDARKGTRRAVTQAICAQAPRRPSTINRALRADLETIVLKALEKDTARRYPSAQELAEDLGRYLNGEPIRARPPSGLYVLRRKLVMHRVAVAVAASVLGLGLVAVGGAFWWHERSLAAAHHVALRLQRDVEGGRAEHVAGAAEALWNERASLPEASLVAAHAMFSIYQATGDEHKLSRALSILNSGPGPPRSDWSRRALWAELHEDGPGRVEAYSEAPDTADAWYLRTFTTLDLEEARVCAQMALARGPDRRLALLVWERLAFLCYTLGPEQLQVTDAIAAAEELMERSGDLEGWLLFKGHVLTRYERYAEAIAQYTQVTSLFPACATAYRYQGVCYLCLKDYENSRGSYSKAVELTGAATYFTYYMRATPRWILGETEEAARDYRASRQSPVFAEYANLRLSLILRDRTRQLERYGDSAGASECQQEASDLLSRARGGAPVGQWSNRILECLAGRLGPDELITEAGTNRERRCEAYYYAGERCRLDEDIDEARRWFAKCRDTGLALDPDTFPPDPMNEYHLAIWRLDTLGGDEIVTSRPGD